METAMPVAGLLRDPSAPGDATPRCASRMRRLLGGLSLLALLAASPARAPTDPPVPSTPADALALLRWRWENRDVARYRELFTDNFRYNYAGGDSSGAAYQTTPWGRADELASATGLFAGGNPAQAPASSIALVFTAAAQPADRSFPGLSYPWHQQLVAPWTLDIARTDGSSLAAGGQSLWFLVRGDSAVIPQELKDRGFSPDPGRWYIERWSEQVDTRPIVSAPSEVSGKALIPITVRITAQDPDGDP